MNFGFLLAFALMFLGGIGMWHFYRQETKSATRKIMLALSLLALLTGIVIIVLIFGFIFVFLS